METLPRGFLSLAAMNLGNWLKILTIWPLPLKNEQMRRDYMADISHELRTPLSVLRGELEAVQDGVRQATPETINSLLNETQTLIKLVNDLHQLVIG